MAVPIEPPIHPLVILSRDLGRNAGRQAARTGLTRVATGVFTRVPADASSWDRERHIAMARVVGAARRTRTAVVSHRTAALVHGLWLVDTDKRVHATQRSKPGRTTEGLYRHSGQLPPELITEVRGLRATTIERTIVDCAKTMHPRDALVVADSGMRALIRPQRSWPERTAPQTARLRSRLLAMVDQGDRRHRRRARAVIEHADPLSESPYETVLRWIALSRGLPRPVLQPRYEIDGHVYYPDMRWRLNVTENGVLTITLTLLAEYDGESKYVPDDLADAVRDLSRTIMEERRRENRLRSQPHTEVERFDRADLRDEDAVFRRICRRFPAGYVATLRPRPDLLGGHGPIRVLH